MDLPASQSSSHFHLEPVSADVLAENEARRRNEARALGLVKSRCAELDGYVLLGGLERGSVVGMSAEEDGMGLTMLAHTLCEEGSGETRVMVVTPKPVTWVAAELRNAVRREVERWAQEQAENDGPRAGETTGSKEKEKVRACLDRVMLSQVFDVDGLWEVLAELDEPGEATDEDRREQPEEPGHHEKAEMPVLEVQDSQDEDGSPLSLPDDSEPAETTTLDAADTTTTAAAVPPKSAHHPQQQPAIILVTHFSSLLTGLFTHREKSAAHSLLQLLSSRLRYLSRNLPSQPLFLLLNSTTATGDEDKQHKQQQQQQQRERERKPLNATLRSVFNPPETPVSGYVPTRLARRNKPMFGMIFAQLLDVHLLCTRGRGGGGGGEEEEEAESREAALGDEAPAKGLTVVEVLLDEMGVWEGKMGTRTSREQRWGAVRVEGGRVVDAFEEGGKRVYEDVRIVAGFGGPRV